MRCTLMILPFLLLSVSGFADTKKCARIVPIISEQNADHVQRLFDFNDKNHGSWEKIGEEDGFAFTFKPTNFDEYQIKWQVKTDQIGASSAPTGQIYCHVPSGFVLSIREPLSIEYPSALHKRSQDSQDFAADSVAGIFFAKAKYSFYPDFARIAWHLNQSHISPSALESIMKHLSMIPNDMISVVYETRLNIDNNASLVAMNISQSAVPNQSNGDWLITNEDDRRAIMSAAYKTDISPHNTWLPWLDKSRPEFSALTPIDAYQKSVLAPVEHGQLFNVSHQKYYKLPSETAHKSQLFYDWLKKYTRDLSSGSKTTFAHLLFRSATNFQLATFSIKSNGLIEVKDVTQIFHPLVLGLPLSVQANDHAVSP